MSKQNCVRQILIDYLKSGKKIDKVKATHKFGLYGGILAARMADIKHLSDNNLLDGFIYRDERLKEHHNSTQYWLERLPVQQDLFNN